MDRLSDRYKLLQGRVAELEAACGQTHDELERRVAERTAELRRANRTLRMISQCNQALVRAINEAGLLDAICRIAVEQGGYRMAWVGIAEQDEAKTVRPMAQAGFETGYLETLQFTWGDTERGHDPTGTAIRTRQPVIARDIATDPTILPWHEAAVQRGYSASAVMPLVCDNHVLGALTVYADEPDTFDAGEVELLTELADNMAYGITSLRTRAERESAEEEVRGLHQRLVNIIEFLPDATFVIDQDKRIVAWNRACETMTGVIKDAVLGLGDYAYAEPFFGERRPVLIDLLDMPSPELEAKYKDVNWAGSTVFAESFVARLRGGQGAYLWAAAAPLFDQEKRRCGAIQVIRDVTELRHAELALRESEQKFFAAFNHAPVMAAITALEDGTYLDVNDKFVEVSGFTRGELLGRTSIEVGWMRAEDRVQLIEAFQRRGKVSDVEIISYAKDGRPIECLYNCELVNIGGVKRLLTMVLDITERKRVERALQESEDRYRQIVKCVPDLIWTTDLSGRFTYANSVVERTHGWTVEEFLELTFRDVVTPEQAVKDAAMLEEELTKATSPLYDRNTVRTFEWEGLRKDGSAFVAEVSASLLWSDDGKPVGVIGTTRDVTERKLAELALQESERKYRELVELANSIILRWAHDGRITFLNEFGQRFFGYSADEIIGRHVMGTIVPETESDGRDLRLLMEQICAAPSAFEQNVNENVRRNGERVWIAWTNRIVWDAQGQVSEILSVGTDITMSKRAEEAIQELNINLERRVVERTGELAVARDRAEAADRLKSAFLASMSHELRTPLNSIIGFTGIILQGMAGPLNEEQGKQLGMVRDSARHLLALINDVLDISKIEAGQLEVKSEPFDLQASIVKVTGIVKPLAEKKGLTLLVELAPEIDVVVSDQRRVEQALLNLLNNAIKFTDRGAVALTAEMRRAHSSLRIPRSTFRLPIRASA